MTIVTIYNIKVNDPGVLNNSIVMETWRSHAIIASFVTIILCQINSLLKKKDHFNKTTISF